MAKASLTANQHTRKPITSRTSMNAQTTVTATGPVGLPPRQRLPVATIRATLGTNKHPKTQVDSTQRSLQDSESDSRAPIERVAPERPVGRKKVQGFLDRTPTLRQENPPVEVKTQRNSAFNSEPGVKQRFPPL
jgi:hypothetical protein